jgi:hypothetical protein
VRLRVEHRPPVAKLHVDRVVGSSGRELGLRRPAILLELLDIPATGHDQPRARLHRPRGGADAAVALLERARADPVDLGAEAQRRANGMEVRIDQAGNDRAAAQIDHARGRTGELANLGRRPDRRDAPITDRDRFLNRRAQVESDDLAVDQDRVWSLRPHRAREPQQEDGQAKAAHAREL